MKTLYTYTIKKYIPSNINEMIMKSSSVFLDVGDGVGVSFLYDEVDNILHPNFFVGTEEPIFTNPVDVRILIGAVVQYDFSLNITTLFKYESIYSIDSIQIKEKTIKDYSKMITELEEKGVVKITKNESFLATDPRSFIFDGKEYPVDCLGTSLCMDITEIIYNEWSKNRV